MKERTKQQNGKQDPKNTRPQPQSIHSAYFKFTNHTGETIKSGTAEHNTTDWGTEKISLDGLPDGLSTEKKSFKTSTTNVDTWKVKFDLDAHDDPKYDQSHDCAIWEEDQEGTVVLSVTLASDLKTGTFNIIPPKSGSCDTSIEKE